MGGEASGIAAGLGVLAGPAAFVWSVTCSLVRRVRGCAGGAMPSMAWWTPSILVGVQLRRSSARTAARAGGWDAAHQRRQALAVVHVRARYAQGQRQPTPVGDQVDLRSQRAAIGRIRSRQRPPSAARTLTESRSCTATSSARLALRDRQASRGGAWARRAPGSTGRTSNNRLPARPGHRGSCRHVHPDVATKTATTARAWSRAPSTGWCSASVTTPNRLTSVSRGSPTPPRTGSGCARCRRPRRPPARRTESPAPPRRRRRAGRRPWR